MPTFSRSIYRYFSVSEDTGSFRTWDAALAFIAQQAKDTHLVFVFDEFPYAAKRNASLISTFQIACDRLFPETSIFLILTGSNQGFMEEKVVGDTDEDSLGEKNPLFGRRTAQIHLGPFGYRDSALMLPGLSSAELVEFYAVFGGTPYYLSMIDMSESLKTNAERLIFRKEGLLYEEPMMLLRQELHEPAIYSSVLDAIAAGANKPQEIADRIGEDRGSVGRYLKTLQSMRFVEKKVPYGEPREKSRKGIYCISEPVFSFWYRFVQPAMDAILSRSSALRCLQWRMSPRSDVDPDNQHRSPRECATLVSRPYAVALRMLIRPIINDNAMPHIATEGVVDTPHG